MLCLVFTKIEAFQKQSSLHTFFGGRICKKTTLVEKPKDSTGSEKVLNLQGKTAEKWKTSSLSIFYVWVRDREIKPFHESAMTDTSWLTNGMASFLGRVLEKRTKIFGSSVIFVVHAPLRVILKMK